MGKEGYIVSEKDVNRIDTTRKPNGAPSSQEDSQKLSTTERALRRLRQSGMQLGAMKPYIGKPKDRNVI